MQGLRSPSKEKDVIKKLNFGENKLQEKERRCLISKKWWDIWVEYTNYDEKGISTRLSSHPGAINNSYLSSEEDPLEIKRSVIENRDFIYLKPAAWEQLVEWYGGGPQYQRKVIAAGLKRECVLELYPIRIICYKSLSSGLPDLSSKTSNLFSKYRTLKEIGKHYSKEKKYRIWLPTTSENKDISNLKWTLVKQIQIDSTLEALNISSGQLILMDHTGNGKWVRAEYEKNWREFEIGDLFEAQDPQKKWYRSVVRDVKNDKIFVHFKGWSNKYDEWINIHDKDRLAPLGTHTTSEHIPMDIRNNRTDYSLLDKGTPEERGVVGLRNLGNTCFLNSTLQCLANTNDLTSYFLSNRYLCEINRNNPLGFSGRIAEEYGSLVKQMFSGEFSVCTPLKLKSVVGEFVPRFSGYSQQDSSEFLSFLLDGLHEDLNLVKDKPYTQSVDSNGRSDDVVAKESWERHLLRNQSIIVEKFQGQIKSRIVCPKCSLISVTFDPFMFLSVPLPSNHEKTLKIRVVFADPRPDVIYQLKLKEGTSFSQLEQQLLLKTTSQKGFSFKFFDFWGGTIHKNYRNSESTDVVNDYDDTYAYELPPYKTVNQIVVLNMAIMKPDPYLYHSYLDKLGIEKIGSPRILVLPTTPDNLSISKLYKIFSKSLSYYSIPPVGTISNSEIIQKVDEDEDMFHLRIFNSNNRCIKCELMQCQGCKIKSDENMSLPEKINVTLVWDMARVNERKLTQVNKDTNVPLHGNINHQIKSLDLSQCLDSFTIEEVLQKGEEWYCPSCKDFRCATKKLTLWKLPDILIIHLKRFSFVRNWGSKIETMVNFPLEGLDISSWLVDPLICGNPIYDCFAVSNHMGGVGGGHYTANARNPINGRWYHFDDSSSRPTDSSQVLSRSAYVLFYSKRGKN